ncbi:hypothetical protein KIH23_03455 [Flavobacterium sp. CYK-55]|uniref:OB-fold putative lipoprotein n=1 Tax=Flavobacterium sp. CYK-55 TaxID=2835529 RepID=UPI001BCB55E9|nr:OB-fold putative lipoprotein [Flavobacterium sp. CYK-55]MBS7786342.1 hypothetical protein [Flavobacterium sp. CYK-55]
MKKSRIIIALVIAVVIGVGVYWYIMHGGARNLASEDAAYTVNANDIVQEFSTNSERANKKYLEKAVVITGKVTEIHANQVIIDNSVVCLLQQPNSKIKLNQSIIMKGRVVGFDDFMGEIKLDQCLSI